MRKFLLNCGIGAFGLCFTLGALELLFRLSNLGSNTHPRSDRPRYYYIPEISVGLEDRKYPAVKTPETFRIVVVGDSFTFGPALQFDDTFPKRLERMLNLNEISNHAEVINLGVPGYSSVQEVDSVQKALALQPDLVLLQITLNDPELQPLNQQPLDVRQQFGPLVLPEPWKTIASHWKSLEYVLQRIHNQRSISAYKKFHDDLFFQADSWGRFSQAIRKMSALCANAKVPFAAVVFPLFDFPLDAQYPFLHIHTKINEHLKELAIPHLDLLQAYSGIPPLRLQTIPGADSHPNEIAHRIASERLYAWLIKNSMVPRIFLSKRIYGQRTDLHGQHRRVKWGEPSQNESNAPHS